MGQSPGMLLAFIDVPIILGVLVLVVPLGIVPVWFLWRILDRAGLAGPLALLWLVPLGSLIILGLLAFSDWPRLPKANAL